MNGLKNQNVNNDAGGNVSGATSPETTSRQSTGNTRGHRKD